MTPLTTVLITFLGLVQCVKLPVEIKDPMEGFSYRTLNGMAMYKPGDAPVRGSPGNGQSYIEFNHIIVDRTDERQMFEAAAIQLVVLPHYDIGTIGVDYMDNKYFCCTPKLKQTMEFEQCRKDSQLNKLISTTSSYDDGHYFLVEFEKGEKHKTVPNWKFDVKETQIHLIAVAVCDSKIGEVTLTGMTEWMNPYGHLPAQLYGFLPFYGWMSVVYLAASLIWFLLNLVYWKELLHVQNCVSGVLVICLVEMVVWYCDYINLNNSGVRQSALFIFGMVTTVSRRTISRMLVVAVSMGYGVVKPILGDEKTKILILGCVYWCFAFAFEFLLHYSQTQEVSPILRSILTPPVAMLDGYFWWWIFNSLNETLGQLKKKRQMAKLRLFKKFSWCLAVSLLAAILVASFQLYFVGMKLYLRYWKLMWIVEVGFWQVLYTVVLFCIMSLWRPSRHASKYAYAQQISTEEIDDGDMFGDAFGKPDTAEAVDDDQFEIGDEHEDASTNFLA